VNAQSRHRFKRSFSRCPPFDNHWVLERQRRWMVGQGEPLDETMDVYRKPGEHVEHWNERANAPGAVVLPDDIADRALDAPLWWWVCTGCRQGTTSTPSCTRPRPENATRWDSSDGLSDSATYTSTETVMSCPKRIRTSVPSRPTNCRRSRLNTD
jgi:hypothetical protein